MLIGTSEFFSNQTPAPVRKYASKLESGRLVLHDIYLFVIQDIFVGGNYFDVLKTR